MCVALYLDIAIYVLLSIYVHMHIHFFELALLNLTQFGVVIVISGYLVTTLFDS